MKKKWIVTYFGPERKPLIRWFRTLTEASLFRTVMQGNLPYGERGQYTATIWHKDDVR